MILLLYDMFSHLYHNDVTDNVAIGISIRVLEFGVALWFSCALWNIKKLVPCKYKPPQLVNIFIDIQTRCIVGVEP